MAIYEKMSQATMGQTIYEIILNRILTFEYQPGERLSENELADRLETSRTPVREAFRQLSGEYLMDILPQRGSYVSKIDISLVEQSRFMRFHIEKAVITECIEHIPIDMLNAMEKMIALQKELLEREEFISFLAADGNFHEILFQYTNKRHIWNMITTMDGQYTRLRYLTFQENIQRKEVVEQHQELLEYLRKKDLFAAHQLLEYHLGKIKEETNILKEKYPNYFL